MVTGTEGGEKVVVPLKLICDAIEMADSGWNQYLDIEKMEIVSLPDELMAGEYDEEDQALADLIEEEWRVRFFGLPSKFDINEYHIMEQFIWELPEGAVQNTLENAIRGKGAFRRFRDAVRRFGLEEQWDDFQAAEYRRKAAEWCEGHGFGYSGWNPQADGTADEAAEETTGRTAEETAGAAAGRTAEETAGATAEETAGAAAGRTAEETAGRTAEETAGAAAEEAGRDGEEDLAWEEIRMEHVVKDEWIDFRRSAYRFPDGSVFEPYYSYSRRDYVVIVASDECGNYLCVRQFRQGIKKVTTEFPAGGIERTDGRECGAEHIGQEAERRAQGATCSTQRAECGTRKAEDALEAARRELLEETGYESAEWRHLLTVPSNATMADNYAYIFAAENCYRSGSQHLDETEFLAVRKYTASEIEEMIEKGEFQQAVHIMAWLLAQKK